MSKHRLRAWLYYWIDRADLYCLNHPRTPAFLRVPVARAWCWMMGRHTWTSDV